MDETCPSILVIYVNVLNVEVFGPCYGLASFGDVHTSISYVIDKLLKAHRVEVMTLNVNQLYEHGDVQRIGHMLSPPFCGRSNSAGGFIKSHINAQERESDSLSWAFLYLHS